MDDAHPLVRLFWIQQLWPVASASSGSTAEQRRKRSNASASTLLVSLSYQAPSHCKILTLTHKCVFSQTYIRPFWRFPPCMSSRKFLAGAKRGAGVPETLITLCLIKCCSKQSSSMLLNPPALTSYINSKSLQLEAPRN